MRVPVTTSPVHLPHLRTLLLLPALAFGACADASGDIPTEAPARATLALELGAPMSSCEDVCVEVALGDAAPARVCATPTDQRATFAVEASCDPSVATVPARVWLSAIHEESPYDAFYDPCGADGCALDVGCGTGTTRAALELAFLNGREFSPVSVATGSAWFYGAAATCQRTADGEGDEPITLAWSDGRHASAYLVFQAAQGVDTPAPALLASTPVLACGDVTCPLPHTADGETTARCSDGASVRYRSYLGAIGFDVPYRYLNLAVDLDSLAATGLTGCQLNAAATFSAGQLTFLGRADAFPVARYHLPLLDKDGAPTCANAQLDAYGHVDDAIVTVAYLRGWNLTPLGAASEALPPLCHTFDGRGLSSTCH